MLGDENARVIIDHELAVEGVEANEAILIALCFLPEVFGVDAAVFNDRGGILRVGRRGKGSNGSR